MTSDTELVVDPDQATGRGDRRARTRLAILDAARGLFAEHGYEQTTIRAVAQRAGVDPALVMQHFGSKAGLFEVASEIDVGFGAAVLGPLEGLGERMLAVMIAEIEHAPEANLAALRSMLTHAPAAEAVRCAFAHPKGDLLAGVLTGEEVELRAGLVVTVLIGLLVTRYLLRIPEVERVSVDRLVSLLGPCLQPLVTDPADGADTAGEGLVGAGAGTAAGSPPSAGGAAEPAQAWLSRLAAAESARRQTADRVERVAREALAAGASYGEVGRAVGISRQAARKRWPGLSTPLPAAPSTT